MPVTEEPRGLNWINNVNMSTFGSLVSQACWFLGSTALTLVACYLLTREDFYTAVGAWDAKGYRQLILMSRETMRAAGQALAYALLAAWTGKTVAGVVDSDRKRRAHPAFAEVVKAKEEGKAAGAAAALVLKEQVLDAKAARETKEHVPPTGGEQ